MGQLIDLITAPEDKVDRIDRPVVIVRRRGVWNELWACLLMGMGCAVRVSVGGAVGESIE
jgi:hypothetical protein